MGKYRIIIMSNNDSKEEIIISEDFKAPASDYLKRGFEVAFDGVRELDLPVEFPLEDTLVKE